MENSDSKDLLLIKCRDTIQQMELKIQSLKSARKKSDLQCYDLQKELNILQSLYLELQSKFQEKDTDSQEYIRQLEALFESEQEKSSKAEKEVKKFSEFILELQEELKTKQDTLIEWNETVCDIEQKIIDLSKENKELKFELDNKFKRVDLDKIEDFKKKVAQSLGVDIKTTEEDLLKLLENNKKQLVLVENDKKDFGVRIQELSEKCVCLKQLYEHKLDEEREKLGRLQKTQERTEEKLQKKKQKIRNLSLSSQSPILTCSTPSSFAHTDPKNHEIIEVFKQKISSLEQSSSRELDFLKNGIERLKDCFLLEISKKEQEMLLKFQPYEQELLQEIQNLQDECLKLKNHYSKLLQYKDEEKSLLEQDKMNLKKALQEIQYRSRTPTNDSKLYFHDLADSSEINPMTLAENLRGYKEAEKEGLRQVVDKKDSEFSKFKKNFEKRWEKKAKETQEKICNWKIKLRDNISNLKKAIGTNQILVAIEKLEKSVGLII